MRHSLLITALTASFAELEKHERFYQLTDKFAVYAHVQPFGDREEADAIQPRYVVHAYEIDDDERDLSQEPGAPLGTLAPRDWMMTDVESLPTDALEKYLAIRRQADAWGRNELDDLPPSTMENFNKERRARRNRRRRLA